MSERPPDGNGQTPEPARGPLAQRLGGMDAMFLSCETPTMHMHVCGLVLMDPLGKSFDPYEKTKEMFAARLPGIAPMRRRLATVPFNIGRPYWVEDSDFDIDRHLRRVRIDAPGDDRQLAELAGDFASTPLPRDRPLWEMLLVEGVSGGRFALVVKMHHATIDGITGANIIGELFDLDTKGRVLKADEGPAGGFVPSPFALAGRAIVDRLAEPVEIAKLLPRTIGQLGGAVRQVLSRRGEDHADMAVPFSAPRTSFNATLSADRCVAFTDVSLAEVKAVKSAHGVKVNDVLTAVVAGALRTYLLDRDELPDRPLVAAEPVSVHQQTAGLDGTTKVSVMFSTLATNVADPDERLELIAEGNGQAKELQSMVGADTLLQWAEHLWLNGLSVGTRLYSLLRGAEHHPVIHNLIFSNVPGPPIALYMAGTKLVGLYPLGPVMDGAGVNITVLSQEDRVGFGIMACPDLVPDVWALAEAIPGALAEMVQRLPSAQGTKAPEASAS